MDIEICPLDKVLVDEEAICLGMEQSTVEAAIGKGILVGTRYYYFNDEMAIDYNDNKVDFIEFLSGTDGMLKPSIKAEQSMEWIGLMNNIQVCAKEIVNNEIIFV